MRLLLILLISLFLSCESQITVKFPLVNNSESGGSPIPPNLVNVVDQNVLEGSTTFSLDFNDENSSSDTDASLGTITYSCKYDILIDGSVSSPADCSSVSGLTFDTSTGVFTWVPAFNAYESGDVSGRYEFKVVAVSDNGSDELVFVINLQDLAKGFVSIKAGEYHVCGLSSAGDMYCWGAEWFGQLGNNSTAAQQKIPVLVDTSNFSTGEKFHEIFLNGASSHTCAVTNIGKAYCWGSEYYGKLGNNSISTNPQPIPDLVDTSNLSSNEVFVEIGMGDDHTCGLTSLGNVFCWGRDQYGQIGNGATAGDQGIPVAVNTTNLAAGEKFKKIAVGYYHSCGLTSLGNIFCWGQDGAEQLGNGVTSTNQDTPIPIDTTNLVAGEKFKDLASGGFVVCASTSLGNSYCWGSNGSGEVGYGGGLPDVDRPTIIDNSNMVAGEVFVQFTSGWDHNCGLTNLGNVYCWGYDGSGGIGNGPVSTDQNAPVLVLKTNLNADENFVSVTAGGYFTCGLTTKGKAYCWGDDSSEQLGTNATTTDTNIPVEVNLINVGAKEAFTHIAAGWFHMCGTTTNGQNFCWGHEDGGGKLGNNSTGGKQAIPVAIDMTNVGSGEIFTQFSGGEYSTCGITDKGNTFCWGDEWAGGIGNGSTAGIQPIPVAVDMTNVPAGDKFTEVTVSTEGSCAITTKGAGYCWGNDGSGQVGNGATTGTQSSPVAVDMSNIPAGDGFIQIAMGSGSYTTCGLIGSGAAYCWGFDSAGSPVVGNGATTGNQIIPVSVDMSNLPANESFTKLAMGDWHVCGLSSGGDVYCWGDNYAGQLGDSSTTDRDIPTIIDNSNLAAGDKFVNIVAGEEHICGVTALGITYCWGEDYKGALGNGSGSTSDLSLPTPISTTNLDTGETFLDFALMMQGTCGFTNLGNTFCWGDDWAGALGDGLPFEDKDEPDQAVIETNF